MKNYYMRTFLILGGVLLTACNQNDTSIDDINVGSSQSSSVVAEREQLDASGATHLVANFSKIINPPLLKKIAMYNAGCIEPSSNYDRDLPKSRELNVDNLRIDLSVGKTRSTAGQYLVTDDFEYSSFDQKNNTYTIDKNSLHYDFSTLDPTIKKITDAGILPYMSWDYIPYPLQENGKWNNLDQNVTNWKEIWEEIYYQYAKHYLDNGTKIGYHEIYNEPDLEILKCWGVFDDSFDGFLNWNDFCLGRECKPGEGVYLDMYKYGTQGILRADPDATIGGPAFALGEIGVEDWVGFLPKVKSDNLPLDFYSFHSYLDGTTWFLPESSRKNGERNEIEKVSQALGKSEKFINTAIHINEYSGLNDKNGSTNGLTSQYNYFPGAEMTMEALDEIVNRTSIQWVHWAQFMESTSGYDPYGVIEHVNGNVKAAYNALKIYQDLPVWRYDLSGMNIEDGIKGYVGSSEDKIGIVLWNTNEPYNQDGEINVNGKKKVSLALKDPRFETGLRRVYKIDKDHASYFDNANPQLVSEDEKMIYLDQNYVWVGEIPANGVVYITLNKNQEADFNTFNKRVQFANDIKTSYLYEDRFRELIGSRESYQDYVDKKSGSYSHFDRTLWKMYLGLGDCLGRGGSFQNQGHANASVLVKELPMKFKVKLETEGEMKMYNKNTTLGFRVDFFNPNTNDYGEAVYFHNGLYRETRNPSSQDTITQNLPLYNFGTKRNAEHAVEFQGNLWDIDLSQYAPDWFNPETGKALISFDMQNTGPNTRAIFSLIK